jgi:uncharacterized membrane protein
MLAAVDKADWRIVFLFLHVLGAVVALGFSLSYGLWVRRAERGDAPSRAFTLGTISWIDRRFTTPAYVNQLATGVILGLIGGAETFEQAWLQLAIGIYVVIVVLAITAYGPAFRAQRQLAERIAGGSDEEAAYPAASSRARSLGFVVTGLTLVVLALMVWKPALWS